jgi:hypothetical protein
MRKRGQVRAWLRGDVAGRVDGVEAFDVEQDDVRGGVVGGRVKQPPGVLLGDLRGESEGRGTEEKCGGRQGDAM